MRCEHLRRYGCGLAAERVRPWALLTAALVLGAAIPAAAAPGLALTGNEGFLALPAAAALPPGHFGTLALMGYERGPGEGQLGIGPLAVGVGLPPAFELGLSVRENGLPRDPVRAGGTVRLGLKLTLVEATASSPAIAVEGYGDHLLGGATPGGRMLVSSAVSGKVMVGVGAGYHAGWRGHTRRGPELGAAVSFFAREDLELLAEASAEGASPWGVLAAVGARWRLSHLAELVVTASSGVVGPAGTRVAVGLSLRSDGEPPPVVVPREATVPPEAAFTTDRPRFRLRVREIRAPADTGYRPLAPESDLDPVEAPGRPEGSR